MRILILEDDVPTAKTLKAMLESLGHQTIVAYSMDKAIESFDAGGVELILSDYALPKGHGVEFIKEIRRRSREVPIVLLTNYAMPHMHAEALAAGANETASKTLSVDALAEILGRFGVLG